MRLAKLTVILGVLAFFAVSAVPASAGDKAPDLGRTKFKDIVKYLGLDASQQAKIKVSVERIQDIVKSAEKHRVGGWTGGGRRAPVGASGAFGRPGSDGGGEVSLGKVEEMRIQRKEWQTEINNRVELIKSFLTPAQLEKFKAVHIPDLMQIR